MKIAIVLDENQQDICPSFGRTPYFLFWEDNQEVISENPAANAQGGAGIQAAQFLVDQKADILITPRCGENAAQVFQTAGIRIYKSVGNSARENLNAYLAGNLQELTHFHAGFHGIQ